MKRIVGWLALSMMVSPCLSQADSSSGYFKSFDGTNIYYEVKGNGSPVILVHGFTGNGTSWKKAALYNDLIAGGYQVITIDLRGNGKSGKPHAAESYANDAEAKDIMGVAGFLKLKEYTVVGYSRGSIITARLLVLDKRVSKAVLGGMGADFTNPEWPRRILFYHLLAGDTTLTQFDSMMKWIESSGLDRTALAMQQKEQPSTSKEELARVSIPVLVICGDEDSDNGSAAELSKLIPGSVHKTVPGKHGGTNDTILFSKTILDFLQ